MSGFNVQYVSNFYITVPIFAVLLPKLLDFLNITNGLAAVQYYGEVHQHPTNKMLHMVLLPWACCGFSLGVPALFKMSVKYAGVLRNFLYITYFVHYSGMNNLIAMIYAIIYFPPLIISHYYYKPTLTVAAQGLGLATGLMLFMEIVGHTFYEIDNSRPEGVLNAILYSHYFISYEWAKFIENL